MLFVELRSPRHCSERWNLLQGPLRWPQAGPGFPPLRQHHWVSRQGGLRHHRSESVIEHEQPAASWTLDLRVTSDLSNYNPFLQLYIIFCCCLVAKSCPILCDPMECSTPGLLVLHHLPEFTQTHVHRVGDAIQPSHPLLSPFSSSL